MEIKICPENEKLIKQLSDGIGLDIDHVVDRIVTFYRSRKRAEELHWGQALYYEFAKDKEGKKCAQMH